jgi:aspartate-semialdehyde dehydrogenase
MSSTPLTVAVLGASGAVGTEMVRVLEQRDFPVRSLKLLATERSAGKTVRFKGANLFVEAVGPGSFKGVDLALFSAGAGPSRQRAPEAVKAGATVVDNSSAWRTDPKVPLVVPEVNAGALEWHGGVIANPNCSTIQMVVALKPIHDAAKITRVIVSTYQAVSGKSGKAMAELTDAARAVLDGKEPPAVLFPKPMAFNVSFDWPFAENGFTEEEMKMTRETVKIMEDESIKVTATTARVPVYRGHSESVYIETAKKITAAEARELLRKAPGVEVVDDPALKMWPDPRTADGKDATYVGRIREDFSHPQALWMWVVSDNLRKGAALNAVQIAEVLMEKDLLKPKTPLYK